MWALDGQVLGPVTPRHEDGQRGTLSGQGLGQQALSPERFWCLLFGEEKSCRQKREKSLLNRK